MELATCGVSLGAWYDDEWRALNREEWWYTVGCNSRKRCNRIEGNTDKLEVEVTKGQHTAVCRRTGSVVLDES